MARIAYYRVSTRDQSIEAQRQALGGSFDREFRDEGISGATQAAKRTGFAEMQKYIREGDSLHVYALDRLGRDSIDVQQTVRELLAKGVAVEVEGIGRIDSKGIGGLILAIFAQMAELERDRIRERTEAGRVAAKASLAATGKTHRGKESLGRPVEHDPAEIATWRMANGKSIAETAAHFEVSRSTVTRAIAKHPKN